MSIMPQHSRLKNKRNVHVKNKHKDKKKSRQTNKQKYLLVIPQMAHKALLNLSSRPLPAPCTPTSPSFPRCWL